MDTVIRSGAGSLSAQERSTLLGYQTLCRAWVADIASFLTGQTVEPGQAYAALGADTIEAIQSKYLDGERFTSQDRGWLTLLTRLEQSCLQNRSVYEG